MKRYDFSYAVIAVAISMGISGSAIAMDPVSSGLTLSVGGAYNVLENCLDDTFAPEVGIGYRFGERFSLEGNYTWYSSNQKPGHNRADVDEFRLDAYVDLLPWDGTFTPYMVAGASIRDIALENRRHDDNRLNAGLGLRKALAPNLSIRGDVRAIRSLDYRETEGSANLALTWTFGSIAAEPVAAVQDPVVLAVVPEEPVVRDSDYDGVEDAVDLCPNSVAGVRVDGNGCAQLQSRVQFGFDSTDIHDGDQSAITEAAQFLQDNDILEARITGHTDSTGAEEYNQALSVKRAEAVEQMLVEDFGIDRERLEVNGKGSADPVASNDTREGRVDNRRMEIITVSPEND